MKRILSFAVALLLVVSIFPMQANATQGGKLAAITFDDGPSGTHTPDLLDGLKKRGVKATFFMLGENAEDNLDVVERAYAEGHEIASHSWSHPDLDSLSDSAVRDQLDSTTNVLDKVCGKGRYLLRAPYGNAGSRVRSIAGVPLIYWSVDPEDWRYHDAYTVRDNIVNNAYDGAIILVHDIYGTSVDGALMAIDEMMDNGYEFVTVSELYRRRGVELEDCEWHYSCKPNGTDVGPIPAPVFTYTTDKQTMKVTITGRCSAPIYYTIDGSQPRESSAVYSGPFNAPYGATIKAYSAYNMNGVRSELATLSQGSAGKPEAPKLEFVNGTVKMSGHSGDETIYYTVDGSNASDKSTVYTGPVTPTKGGYIHAVSAGGYHSGVSAQSVVYYSERGILSADLDPDEWYFNPIDRLASLGLMSGVGHNKFAPKTKLTRGMLVTMLYAYSEQKLENGWSKTNPFTDIESDDWFAEAVEWAYRNNVTVGFADGTFKPGRSITREELSVMVDSFLTNRGHALKRGESCEGKFGDYGQISDWALSSIEAMVQAGLLEGDGRNVNPGSNATRAETAAILCQMIDYEAAHKNDPPQTPTEPTAPESTAVTEAAAKPAVAETEVSQPTVAETEVSQPTEAVDESTAQSNQAA